MKLFLLITKTLTLPMTAHRTSQDGSHPRTECFFQSWHSPRSRITTWGLQGSAPRPPVLLCLRRCLLSSSCSLFRSSYCVRSVSFLVWLPASNTVWRLRAWKGLGGSHRQCRNSPDRLSGPQRPFWLVSPQKGIKGSKDEGWQLIPLVDHKRKRGPKDWQA